LVKNTTLFRSIQIPIDFTRLFLASGNILLFCKHHIFHLAKK